jgi:purine-binding chemotaxis protein CheW
MVDSRQFATFLVNDLFFGVGVREVQEVLRFQAMTRVPLAPKVLRGLINLRGQIVTAIDMRERLGIPPAERAELPINLIVRADEGAVSLLVDEIGDVIDVDSASFERVPETFSEGIKQIIDGVYKLDGQLLLVMNTDRTLQILGAAS